MTLFPTHLKIALTLSVLILSGQANNSQAQITGDPGFFIEGGLRYGTALYHPTHDIYLRNLHFGSFEMRAGIQTDGDQPWEKALNKPILGLALRYTDYTGYFDRSQYQLAGTEEFISAKEIRKELLGENLTLFGYFQLPLIRYGRFTWHVQAGMGFGFFTGTNNQKTISVLDYYDHDGNPSEEAITKHLSNDIFSLAITPYVNIQSGIDIRLSNRTDLTLNANFAHASNGSLKLPNYGINEVQGIAGLRYHLKPNPTAAEKQFTSQFKPSNALFFSIEPGWLWARYNNYYYFKNSISFGCERQFFPILKIGAALEANLANRLRPTPGYDMNGDGQPDHSDKDGLPYKTPQNVFAGSIFTFGDITFGRVAVHLGFGAYLYRNPADTDLSMAGAYSGTLLKPAPVYERAGFKIYLGKKEKHFAGFIIKAHFPVADYVSLSYGYRFYTF